MATVDRIQLSIIGYHPSAMELVSVLDYALVGGGSFAASIADLDTFLGDFEAAVMADYLACIGTNYTLDRIEARGVLANVVVNATDSFTLNSSPGTAAAVGGPVERCLHIAKLSARAGPSGRGRIFMPMPVAAAYDSAGHLVTFGAHITAANALCASLMTTFVVGLEATVVPVIAHRAGGSTAITRFTVPARCGVQRDRRYGIGA